MDPTVLMNPTVLVVQHSADDPPGRLGGWLLDAGCTLDVVRCFEGRPLPISLAGVTGLVVLGGAMGAYDDARFPWLSRTKALLREAATRDVPTLGVCLGHQLLAVAAGGRVATAPAPQLGVTAVRVTRAAAEDPLFAGLPIDPTAVHWNNDLVVAQPPGSVLLSTSAAGVQALRLGSSVWGVQFHPEVAVETVSDWAADDVSHGAISCEQARLRLAEVAAVDELSSRTWHDFVQRFAGVLHAAGPS